MLGKRTPMTRVADPVIDRRRARAHIAPCLGLIGWGGSALMVTLVHNADTQRGMVIIGIATLFLAILGAVCVHRIKVLWYLALTIVGAMAIGATLSWLWYPTDAGRIVAGGLGGALMLFPLLPITLTTFVLVERLGRARAGSLIDAADLRAPWTLALATFTACIAVAAVTRPRCMASRHVVVDHRRRPRRAVARGQRLERELAPAQARIAQAAAPGVFPIRQPTHP